MLSRFWIDFYDLLQFAFYKVIIFLNKLISWHFVNTQFYECQFLLSRNQIKTTLKKIQLLNPVKFMTRIAGLAVD